MIIFLHIAWVPTLLHHLDHWLNHCINLPGMSSLTNPRHENLSLRVWEIGTDIPTGLLCLEPDCDYNGAAGKLERSHFISRSMLYAIGYSVPCLNFDGEVESSADSSSPFWTRLLLCSNCEKKQGETSLDNLRCKIKPDISKKKREKVKTIRLFVTVKDAVNGNTWLQKVNAIRDCIDLEPMHLSAEHNLLFSKLIWRCRLMQSCEKTPAHSIDELHKWPLDEDYVVWVDMGEPLDDVVPVNKPFKASGSPDEHRSTLDYLIRFQHCFYMNSDYIKVGHVHIITSVSTAKFGFKDAAPRTVLFCPPPNPLREFLISLRPKLAMSIDQMLGGDLSFFKNLASAMRTEGYDAPDPSLSGEEVHHALYHQKLYDEGLEQYLQLNK